MKKLLDCLALPFVFALPLVDFALMMRIVYVATVPDLMSPFVAIFVGLVLSAFVCVVIISQHGNTVIEINIGAFILLVLLAILYPVAATAPAKRRANLQKRVLKAKQQRLLQLTPTPVKHR